VAKGATETELKLFLNDNLRRGIHPLDKLLHFSVRTDTQGQRSYTPITSIDFFRMRAESSGAYAGNDDPVFVYDGKQIKSATASVYKIVQGLRCPFTATARWEQYAVGGKAGFMWNKMPELMLGKCAEALALRKAFPGELHGLYAKEEMDQAGNDVVDIETSTPKQSRTSAIKEKLALPPTQTTEPVASTDPVKEAQAVFPGANEAKEPAKKLGHGAVAGIGAVKALWSAAGQNKKSEEDVRKILADYGIESTKEIPVHQYNAIYERVSGGKGQV